MAGEYSRELGIKVFAAHCRQVNLGFRQGGSPGFGLRRQLIDENGNAKGLLKRGERKYLQTDRVILLPGPSQEVELVRNIFRQFVVEHKSRAEIARELNEKGLVNHCGRPWTSSTIRGLLKNENYVGNNVYNRKTSWLRQKQTDNPSNLWIRAAGVFEGIIEPSLFARAQGTRWNRRHLFVSDREMLAGLNSLLQEKGRLSCKLIDEANDIPNHSTYFERFGSLRNAYELIDYRPPEAIFNDTDGGTTTTSKMAVEIIAKLEGAGGSAVFDEATDTVTINSNLTISIYVARCRCDAGRGLLWSVRRRANFRGGWIIALRIDQTGRNVIDYLLIPATNFSKSRMEFSERNQARLNACRFENVDALVNSIWSQ